nr:class I SAM-dependent methyltransferase [Thiocapsa sp.]
MRRTLGLANVYDLFQDQVGARRFRKMYVASYVRPKPGLKILDIGCGTGAILPYLPKATDYVGFDLSSEYIQSAKKRYGDKGEWHCAPVSEMSVDDLGTFDIVMANGVLHHLDDPDAMRLAEVASKALKPKGRFCSYDGCFTASQSKIARYIISKDRGLNVREPEGYVSLVRSYFSSVELSIRHDMLRIPYTHAIIVATNG